MRGPIQGEEEGEGLIEMVKRADAAFERSIHGDYLHAGPRYIACVDIISLCVVDDDTETDRSS